MGGKALQAKIQRETHRPSRVMVCIISFSCDPKGSQGWHDLIHHCFENTAVYACMGESMKNYIHRNLCQQRAEEARPSKEQKNAEYLQKSPSKLRLGFSECIDISKNSLVLNVEYMSCWEEGNCCNFIEVPYPLCCVYGVDIAKTDGSKYSEDKIKAHNLQSEEHCSRTQCKQLSRYKIGDYKKKLTYIPDVSYSGPASSMVHNKQQIAQGKNCIWVRCR